MLSRLLEAHELIIGEVRNAITATTANRDDGTNGMLIADVLRCHELQVWFIAEHLVDTPGHASLTHQEEPTMTNAPPTTAANAGILDLGGDLTVHRLGYGAMRITGDGIWGEPPDREGGIATLRRAIELGVNFIDTADSYGPEVSETLIAETLHPVETPWPNTVARNVAQHRVMTATR